MLIKQKKLKPDESKSVARAKLKEQQGQLSWDEDGIADNKGGLKIVILKHMFNPKDAKDSPDFYDDLKAEVGAETESKCGKIEKLTVFEKNPEGVIAIRFGSATAAEKCIQLMNGRWFGGNQIECDYFDGITDYRVRETEQEMEARLKAFSEWIEGAETPNENSETTTDTNKNTTTTTGEDVPVIEEENNEPGGV